MHKIPLLKYDLPQVDENIEEQTIKPNLKRSPFTLLPKELQEQLLERYSGEISEKVGFPLRAWTEPGPKTKERIQKLMEHYHPELKQGGYALSDLTVEAYMEVLKKHIKVVARPKRLNEDGIIGRPAENPDMSKYLTTQNVARMMLHDDDSALAFDFTGLFFQMDGGGTMLDEIYRFPQDFKDINLDSVSYTHLTLPTICSV